MDDSTTPPLIVYPTREGASVSPAGRWLDAIIEHVAISIHRDGLCDRLDEYGGLLIERATTRPAPANEEDAEEMADQRARLAELRENMRLALGGLPAVVLDSSEIDRAAEGLGEAVVELLRRNGQPA